MKAIKNLFLFLLGAVCYPIIEILWRGRTHSTMALTGGVVFTVLYRFYKKYNRQRMIKRCVCGSLIITSIELISGLIFNRIFDLGVWDYSERRFNYKGQICLSYSVLWALLCIPVSGICKFIANRKKNIFLN